MCTASGACIAANVTPSTQFEGLTFECDPDDAPGSTEAGFTPPLPAPAGSGVAALSLMNVVAENEVGMIQFGASYLVAELPEGACLLDLVHGWDMRPSYVETVLGARWQPNGAGFLLRANSRRIQHEPLDESESAEGVSDARADFCEDLEYEVSGGRFKRVGQRTSKGACPSLDPRVP
jgi:hypothetical protein